MTISTFDAEGTQYHGKKQRELKDKQEEEQIAQNSAVQLCGVGNALNMQESRTDNRCERWFAVRIANEGSQKQVKAVRWRLEQKKDGRQLSGQGESECVLQQVWVASKSCVKVRRSKRMFSQWPSVIQKECQSQRNAAGNARNAERRKQKQLAFK